MNRRVFLGLIMVSLLLTTAASRAITTTPPQAPAASVVSIPFEVANRHIIVKVKVGNSRALSFILDTGDKYAIINLDRAKELGLTLEGEVRMGGAGAETSIGAFVKDSTFTVPGLAGFSQPVNLALPIGRLASRLGQDFDGIIGSEFIKEFVVEVDYPARVLRFHNKDKFVYSGPGQSIPVQVNAAGHPILEAEVTPIGSDPVKGKFVLDIGSGGALILHSPFVSQRGLLNPNLKTIKAIGMGGAGGKVTGRIGRVSELKIGNFKINTPITMFAEDKQGLSPAPPSLETSAFRSPASSGYFWTTNATESSSSQTIVSQSPSIAPTPGSPCRPKPGTTGRSALMKCLKTLRPRKWVCKETTSLPRLTESRPRN